MVTCPNPGPRRSGSARSAVERAWPRPSAPRWETGRCSEGESPKQRRPRLGGITVARSPSRVRARRPAPLLRRPTLHPASPQEKRVLALIADGNTNKEVAVKLELSEKTVKNYLSTIFEKLHVTRRAEAAVIYAQENKRAEG